MFTSGLMQEEAGINSMIRLLKKLMNFKRLIYPLEEKKKVKNLILPQAKSLMKTFKFNLQPICYAISNKTKLMKFFA